MSNPYRLFFPAGIFYLLSGVLLWLPQIWNSGNYPVLLHRYLVLNGFTASFIAGFLMTAIPRFSQTFSAQKFEILSFFIMTLVGLVGALLKNETAIYASSALQAIVLLGFIGARIKKRKANPPYSFVFIFVGLILWLISSFAGLFVDYESFKQLHFEGAITCIILGVGSRLIPGILGHIEVVSNQRQKYETTDSLISTIPLHFGLLILAFVASYFLPELFGANLRALVVGIIAFAYWRIFELPKNKSALNYSIWISAWSILLSFILKGLWQEGTIHASHSFFISGIVLLSLLIATRVIVSHSGQNAELENSKWLYFITGMVLLSASTRVSAYLMPEHYLTHLGYSSLILALAVIIWSFKYLKFALNTKV